MSFLGHPSTREEEDTCYIATSYDLDRERLDWESTAIVAWAIAAPSGTDRTDVDDVFRRKFRLRASEGGGARARRPVPRRPRLFLSSPAPSILSLPVRERDGYVGDQVTW